MAVVNITETDFDFKVISAKNPVLLDYFASWCGPCKLAEPILEELSEEYKEKVDIMKIDVDKNQKLSQDQGVMSIPTTILYKEGKEVGRQVGFAGKKAFEDLMNKGL